jgi:hypothetical protein
MGVVFQGARGLSEGKLRAPGDIPVWEKFKRVFLRRIDVRITLYSLIAYVFCSLTAESPVKGGILRHHRWSLWNRNRS